MSNKLVVIYYHEVVEPSQGFSYQRIEIDKFEEQMRFLRDNGYQTLFFSELEKSLPEKAVVVSFDDGFRTVYEKAAPTMKKYGIKGNIYLPTAYIDADSHFMTWAMTKELYHSHQFEMQAHTHNHKDIRLLSEDGMKEEIDRSNRMFREHLGYEPIAFCMPFGTYDRKSVRILKDNSNYKYLLGSYYGTVSSGKMKRDILPRIGISNDDQLSVFQNKLEGKLNWKGPLQKLRLCYKNLKKERIEHYEY